MRPPAWRQWLMRLTVAVLAVLAVALPSSVQAFEVRNEDEVVIPADEQLNSGLLVRANRFVVDGTVSGEVTVYAREVIITGEVRGNLTAVAPVIRIDGEVQGMATLIGQDINVNGTLGAARLVGRAMVLEEQSRIERGALAAGSSLTQRTGSSIGQSLMFSGLFSSLNGQIGTANDPGGVGMGNTQVVSLFNGDQPPAWLGLAAPAAQTNPDAVEEATASEQQGALLTWLLNVLRRFAGLVVFGGLLLMLFPRILNDTAALLPERPLASLGWGIVALPLLLLSPIFVMFAAGLVIFSFDIMTLRDLTLLSLLSSGVILVAQILLIIKLVGYISIALVGYGLGQFYFQRTQPERTLHPIVPLLVGAGVVSIALYLPAIGAVISLLCTLIGLGMLWRLRQQRRQTAPQSAPFTAPFAADVPA